MSVEENKKLVRQMYEEVVNQGQIELADKYISADTIEHEDLNTNGLESFKNFFAQFRQSFPDLKFTINDMIAEADKVVCRITVTGTHNGDGEFWGLQPNGNKIEVETIDIIRLKDGMMVEHWGRTDTLCMLEQLNQEPTPETVSKIRIDP